MQGVGGSNPLVPTNSQKVTKTSFERHTRSHPGEILRELYLEPMGITITGAAEALDVSRKHVSAIINGHSPVTPDMAMRLAVVFSTEPEIWINLQAQYDLWTVSRKARPKVKPLRDAA